MLGEEGLAESPLFLGLFVNGGSWPFSHLGNFHSRQHRIGAGEVRIVPLFSTSSVMSGTSSLPAPPPSLFHSSQRACYAVISLGSFKISLAIPHPWNLEA